MKLRLSTAEAVIAEAKEAILVRGLPPMSISVVDERAHLVAFCRMDGAAMEATDMAHRKARTAALCSCTRAARPLETNDQRLEGGAVLPGARGEVIGAVGVAGGSMQDEAYVAQTAAAAIVG